MEIQLFVKSKAGGSVRTFRFPAGQTVVAGRNPDAAVPLDGNGLSRDHFSIESTGGCVLVADNSSNGTWVNGALVGRGQKREIRPEDVVEVAGYEINYRLIREPAVATAAPVPIPARRQGPVWQAIQKTIGPPLEGVEKFSLLLVAATVVLTVIYMSS